MDNYMGLRIVVEGDYALFTRPEFKSERVSYDVPTVSAIEGILKAVYWKPAIRYVVDKIVVFNPIQFINIRRNEVSGKVSYDKVKKCMKGTSDPTIYTSEMRSQRDSRMLKNVKYGIEFHIEMTGIQSTHENECRKKHSAIFQIRVKEGKWFQHPSLGCSELGIRKMELVENDFNYYEISPQLHGDVDLGYMLYDLKFKDKIPEDKDWHKAVFSDEAKPYYYRPHMINGIIDVRKYRRDILC